MQIDLYSNSKRNVIFNLMYNMLSSFQFTCNSHLYFQFTFTLFTNMKEQQVNDATVKNARHSFACGFNYLWDVFKR